MDVGFILNAMIAQVPGSGSSHVAAESPPPFSWRDFSAQMAASTFFVGVSDKFLNRNDRVLAARITCPMLGFAGAAGIAAIALNRDILSDPFSSIDKLKHLGIGITGGMLGGFMSKGYEGMIAPVVSRAMLAGGRLLMGRIGPVAVIAAPVLAFAVNQLAKAYLQHAGNALSGFIEHRNLSTLRGELDLLTSLVARRGTRTMLLFNAGTASARLLTGNLPILAPLLGMALGSSLEFGARVLMREGHASFGVELGQGIYNLSVFHVGNRVSEVAISGVKWAAAEWRRRPVEAPLAGFHTDESAAVAEFQAQHSPGVQRDMVKAFHRQYGVLSRQAPIYQEVNVIFERLLDQAAHSDPALAAARPQLLIADSAETACRMSKEARLVILNTGMLETLHSRELLTTSHVAFVLGRALRHFSQSKEDGREFFEQELDADFYGMRYASQASYNPVAAVDMTRLFHDLNPTGETGSSYVKFPLFGLTRIAHARQVNREPLPGSELNMKKTRLVSPLLPPGQKRAFQEAVMDYRHFEVTSARALIERAETTGQLLLITHHLQDLVLFSVARAAYRQLPLDQILCHINQDRLLQSEKDRKVKAVAWSLELHEHPDPGSGKRYETYDSMFPGLSEKVSSESADIEQALRRLDSADYWKALHARIPYLFTTPIELIGDTHKVELLQRVAWMGLCENLRTRVPLFPCGSGAKGRSWSLDEVPSLRLSYKDGTQYGKTPNAQTLDVVTDLSPVIQASMRAITPIASTVEGRYRELLASEYGVHDATTQDLCISLNAGVLAGDRFDRVSRQYDALGAWERRYPEFRELSMVLRGQALDAKGQRVDVAGYNLRDLIGGWPDVAEELRFITGDFQVVVEGRQSHHSPLVMGKLSLAVDSDIHAAKADILAISEPLRILAEHPELAQQATRLEVAVLELGRLLSGIDEWQGVVAEELPHLIFHNRHLVHLPVHSRGDDNQGHSLRAFKHVTSEYRQAVVPRRRCDSIADIIADREMRVALEKERILSEEDPIPDLASRVPAFIAKLNELVEGAHSESDDGRIARQLFETAEVAPLVDFIVGRPDKERRQWVKEMIAAIHHVQDRQGAWVNRFTLLAEIESEAVRRLEQAPDFYSAVIDEMHRHGYAPQQQAAILRLMEINLDGDLQALRSGKVNLGDFCGQTVGGYSRQTLGAYSGYIYRFLMPHYVAFVEHHPYLQAAMPYFFPEEGNNYHAQVAPVRMVLDKREIYRRAGFCFPRRVLKDVERLFVVSFTDYGKTAQAWRSKDGEGNSFKIEDPFALFLLPLVVGTPATRRSRFSSLEEAVLCHLEEGLNPFPLAHMRRMLWIMAEGKTEREIFEMVTRVHDAYRRQAENLARVFLDREPRLDEVQDFVHHYRSYDQHTHYGAAVYGDVMGHLSWFRALAIRKGDDGDRLDRETLKLSIHDLYKRSAQEMPDLDVSRSVRGDYYPTYEGHKDGAYAHLAFARAETLLRQQATTPARLQSAAIEAGRLLQGVYYRENYLYRTKPISVGAVSHGGISVTLDINEYVEKMDSVRVERLYRLKRARGDLTDVLLEHSHAELEELNWTHGEAATLVGQVRKQLRSFSEARLPTRDRVEIVLAAIPFRCLERDALLEEIAERAPASYDADWHWFGRVTGNLLTVRRIETIGKRHFDRWIAAQTSDTLERAGIDGVVSVLQSCFPKAGYVRDDAVDRLLNGTVDRPLHWVTTLAQFDRLAALKQGLEQKTRKKIQAPQDLTDGLMITELFAGLPRESKSELLFWLLGKREWPPHVFMQASLSLPKERYYKKIKQFLSRLGLEVERDKRLDPYEAVLKYKGQHFETLKDNFKGSGKNVFAAQLLSILSGPEGLLRSAPLYKPETFLNTLLDHFGAGVVPQRWREFFISYFENRSDDEGAYVIAEILYRLRDVGDNPTRDQLLDIFIHACGFEAVKLAQIAAQQSELIKDESLRTRLARFQSLPEAGRRDEAMFHLRRWARDHRIPETSVRLGRLIATGSAGQVYEVAVQGPAGVGCRYAGKFVFQRNRFGLEERIDGLQATLETYRARTQLDFDIPVYLFRTLKTESSAELSLDAERAKLVSMARTVAASDENGPVSVRVPGVAGALCTDTVLLMQLVEGGVPLAELATYVRGRASGQTAEDPSLEPLRPHYPAIVATSGNRLKRQAISGEDYHGDLHFGNILVTMEAGRPVTYWIDAANNKRGDMSAVWRNAAALSAIYAAPRQTWLRTGLAMGLSVFYPQMSRSDMQTALTRAWGILGDRKGLMAAHRGFVLSLAKGDQDGFLTPDLGLMTAVAKAKDVLAGPDPH